MHKKMISVQDAAGRAHQEGRIGATRRELNGWVRTLPQPRGMAMEATMFSGWTYDHLLPYAEAVKSSSADAARSLRLKRRTTGSTPARSPTASDVTSCPSATWRRRRSAGLLMETGVSYNKLRLHRMGYFEQLLATSDEVSDSIRPLLKLSREHIDRSIRMDAALLRSLEHDPLLTDRLRRLRTVPGVGPITALTWALEIGDTARFRSIKQAISYCGLCSAEKSSADKVMRTPISKQRNKHIQQVLVEAARLAPRYSEELALLYERERQRGNSNRATLAVARKLVTFMLAVERRGTDFVAAEEFRRTAAARTTPSQEGKNIRISEAQTARSRR